RGWRRRVREPRPRARAPRTTPGAVRARAHAPRARDAATPESRATRSQGIADARARGVRRARRAAVVRAGPGRAGADRWTDTRSTRRPHADRGARRRAR